MNFVGQLGSNFLEDLAPIIAIIFTFGTPMIWMLLSHQRKMAETLRGDRNQNEQLAQLQNQVNQLSHLVHQQTIALDDLRSRSLEPARTEPPQFKERFTSLNEP